MFGNVSGCYYTCTRLLTAQTKQGVLDSQIQARSSNADRHGRRLPSDHIGPSDSQSAFVAGLKTVGMVSIANDTEAGNLWPRQKA